MSDITALVTEMGKKTCEASRVLLGAEIGISTSKLQTYGPMGIRELTTTKFVVLGSGQLRK